MAELLWNCGYEEKHRGIEWMVVPSNQGMHMETMEAAEDKDEKSDETRNPEILCSYDGQQSQRELVHISYKHGQQSLIKRKTDTQCVL